MSLIKHDYPILERDTEQTAIIMPDRNNLYQFPQRAVFAFLGDYLDEFVKSNSAEKIGEFKSVTKIFPIYKTVYNDEEICFCQAPVGAAAATQVLDFLFSYGVEAVISCGNCGTLHDIPENTILIPTPSSSLTAEKSPKMFIKMS